MKNLLLWLGIGCAGLFALLLVVGLFVPSPATTDTASTSARPRSTSSSPSASPTAHGPGRHRAGHQPRHRKPTARTTSPGTARTHRARPAPRPRPHRVHRHVASAAATVGGLYAVIRVVDGDTVHVAYHGDADVRIIGINTPETVDPFEPVECGGPVASAEAHRLLDGRRVHLVFDSSQGRVDKYGRTLAYLVVPGIGDYGRFMVRHGFAFEYTYDTAYHHRGSYLAAQSYARGHRLGVWGHCGGTLRPLHQRSHHSSATHAASPQSSRCTPGYSPCLPVVADWDCQQLEKKGLAPVRVTGSDPYGLDEDGDGWGCES